MVAPSLVLRSMEARVLHVETTIDNYPVFAENYKAILNAAEKVTRHVQV